MSLHIAQRHRLSCGVRHGRTKRQKPGVVYCPFFTRYTERELIGDPLNRIHRWDRILSFSLWATVHVISFPYGRLHVKPAAHAVARWGWWCWCCWD